MTPCDSPDIGVRLARLERANARLRRVVAVLSAAAALPVLSLLLGQAAPQKAPPQTIAARSFELVDRGGAVRGRLGLGAGDAPFLQLYDDKGAVRAAFFVAEDRRPAVTMLDGSGRPRATVGLEPADVPFIRLNDKDGKQVWAAP